MPISKINGINVPLAKLNGVPWANIAKINGVSVGLPAYSNASFIFDNLTSLSGWVDEDISSGVSTQEVWQTKETFKCYCPNTISQAARAKDFGSFASDRLTFSVRAWFVGLDPLSAEPDAGKGRIECIGYSDTNPGISKIVLHVYSDRIRLATGVGWSDYVAAIPSGEWIVITVDHDATDPVTATGDLYVNGVKVLTGVDTSSLSGNDGEVRVIMYGAPATGYYDWVAVGNDLVAAEPTSV